MGAWGTGTFEDDIACDWLEDLYDSDPVAFFRHCLDLSDQPEGLSHVAAIGVLCTSEMIEGVLCQPRPGLPTAAARWIDNHRMLPLRRLQPAAVIAMRRILESDCELHIKWQDEVEQYHRWRAGVVDLANRLAGRREAQL